MTTITLPADPVPSAMSWRLVQPAQNNISEWTGARQTVASNRGWWECQLELPPIVGTTNFNAWRAFVASMRGPVNTVQIPVDPVAQSALANTARVNGAGQYGRSIVTDGWPSSTTVLYAGQFVTIGDQLLQLTSNITSDGSGNATISFEPHIRVLTTDNAVIEYKNPYCLMYLDEVPPYNVESGYVYSLSMTLRESF